MRSHIYQSLVILLSISLNIPAKCQVKALDSLKKELLVQHQDSNMALTYLRISEQYMGFDSSKKVENYIDSALWLSRKISFRRGEASALENHGFGYLAASNYDSAKKDFLNSIEIRKQIDDQRGIAQSYLSIGRLYYVQDSLFEAYENFNISLKRFEEIGNKKGIAICRAMISQINLDQGNDSEALVNTQLATNANMALGDHMVAANLVGQMANIEFDRQHYDMALKYYLELIHMIKEFDLPNNFIKSVHMLVGTVYQKQGDMEFSKGNKTLGLQKYVQALAMFDSAKTELDSNAKDDAIELRGQIAKIHIRLNKFSGARKDLEEYLQLLLKYRSKADIADVYTNLSNVDSAQGYFKKAFSEYKLAMIYRDSVTEFKNNRKLLQAEMRHEYDIREDEAKVLQAKKDAEVRDSRNKQNLAIVSLAILILAAFSIALIQWRNNKSKQRTNKLLENTLSDLRSTQTQLIQSEKLASLGELTAGIAHEIQNPLNFVNNFSEVNTELVSEMKEELKKGNPLQAAAIADDIEKNLEKINLHGKRADSIVKGMLLHSRANSGQKEPTDINLLAEEWLRLAYQGMRTKDKLFKATIIKEFDETIGRINIVPQDMGRVMLNLYNNAFYAVNEKSKEKFDSYEPAVTIVTSKSKGSVEIRIKDNGNGIPQNIVDKIYQPFFTTKPAGQGTGLGLSLSYDIVKAHGGYMQVKTEQGKGTEFTVQLQPD